MDRTTVAILNLITRYFRISVCKYILKYLAIRLEMATVVQFIIVYSI